MPNNTAPPPPRFRVADMCAGTGAFSHALASTGGFYPVLGTISRKTSDSTDKFNGQNPLDIAIANALELLRGHNFEIDPVVTRAPPGMQNMSKNMAKMST
jgi:hypothetical protein